MKVITCASYHGTGSSAITNFFSEFSNCTSIGEFEVRFIHDPDGIRDLEYNLIENNNRLNTGYAIKRYIKNIKYLNGNFLKKRYRKYWGSRFLELSNNYISDITELISNSSWKYDEKDRGAIFDIFSTIYRKLFQLFNPEFEKSILDFFNEKSYYSAIDKEQFYFHTKKYINSVLSYLNKDNTEYLMMDQLVPPSNISQYLDYFYDIKIVVVDRDPRDLFILVTECWKSSIVPHKSVEDFCKWYEITRRHRKNEGNFNSDNVLFIQFEDLIYKYEETTKKLMNFVGIDPKDHTMPKSYLNPTVSIKNTNLKHKYPKYKMEIEYIENYLQEFLYNFPSDNN